MQVYQLDNFKNGWFVGDFVPSIFRIQGAEIGIKHYKSGTAETSHYHKEADELTAIVNGIVSFNGVEFGPGDIVHIEKNEISAFTSITDSILCIVKIPSVMGDKHVID